MGTTFLKTKGTLLVVYHTGAWDLLGVFGMGQAPKVKPKNTNCTPEVGKPPRSSKTNANHSHQKLKSQQVKNKNKKTEQPGGCPPSRKQRIKNTAKVAWEGFTELSSPGGRQRSARCGGPGPNLRQQPGHLAPGPDFPKTKSGGGGCARRFFGGTPFLGEGIGLFLGAGAFWGSGTPILRQTRIFTSWVEVEWSPSTCGRADLGFLPILQEVWHTCKGQEKPTLCLGHVSREVA